MHQILLYNFFFWYFLWIGIIFVAAFDSAPMHTPLNTNNIDYATMLDQIASLQSNILLEEHSRFFNATVYHLGGDAYTRHATPINLCYDAYSAVGFGLANSLVLARPEGIVVIDTGEDVQNAQAVIQALREAKVFDKEEKIPLRAIIYTHNHIDHTAGVQGWLDAAEQPPCPAENPDEAAPDGLYKSRDDCVEIIAYSKVTDAIINTNLRVGPMINTRSGYIYGVLIPGGPINAGIGMNISGGDATYFPPSKTLSKYLILDVIGLRLTLYYAPSETDDEIIVFAPDNWNIFGKNDSKSLCDTGKRNREDIFDNKYPVPDALGIGLLFSAEVIQGPSFPNLYSLRGTSFRDPLNWYTSVDLLRQFQSWAMMPSHGVPLMEKANVDNLLVTFRDAIAYTHDQALRKIRVGYIPDELAAEIRLPEYLLDNVEKIQNGLPSEAMNARDYLRAFYGSVEQSVREIYSGYMGWNHGDPTFFKPAPPVDRAQRYVDAMGGREAVMSQAEAAYKTGISVDTFNKRDIQWAAEILTYVIRANTTDYEARMLKSLCLLQLAQQAPTEVSTAQLEEDVWSLNPNWRNWLVVGAEELLFPQDIGFPNHPLGLSSPNITRALKPGAWVQQFSWMLKSESTMNLSAPISVGFSFLFRDYEAPSNYEKDQLTRCILTIDRGVARFTETESVVTKEWTNNDIELLMNFEAYSDLVIAQRNTHLNWNAFDAELTDLVTRKKIEIIKGDFDQTRKFFSFFDSWNSFLPRVVGK